MSLMVSLHRAMASYSDCITRVTFTCDSLSAAVSLYSGSRRYRRFNLICNLSMSSCKMADAYKMVAAQRPIGRATSKKDAVRALNCQALPACLPTAWLRYSNVQHCYCQFVSTAADVNLRIHCNCSVECRQVTTRLQESHH